MSAPTCTHDDLSVTVKAVRFSDAPPGPGRTLGMIEVTVACKTCGTPMHVPGLPPGISMTGATGSPDGSETRLPFWEGPSEMGKAMQKFALDRKPE